MASDEVIEESVKKMTELIQDLKGCLEKFKDKPKLVLGVLEELNEIKLISYMVLKQTGIGKTVNGFRKYEGKVGEIARTIVGRWKELASDAIKLSKAKATSAKSTNADESSLATVDSASINEQLSNHYNAPDKVSVKREKDTPVKRIKKEKNDQNKTEAIKKERQDVTVKKEKQEKLKEKSCGDILVDKKKVKAEKPDKEKLDKPHKSHKHKSSSKSQKAKISENISQSQDVSFEAALAVGTSAKQEDLLQTRVKSVEGDDDDLCSDSNSIVDTQEPDVDTDIAKLHESISFSTIFEPEPTSSKLAMPKSVKTSHQSQASKGKTRKTLEEYKLLNKIKKEKDTDDSATPKIISSSQPEQGPSKPAEVKFTGLLLPLTQVKQENKDRLQPTDPVDGLDESIDQYTPTAKVKQETNDRIASPQTGQINTPSLTELQSNLDKLMQALHGKSKDSEVSVTTNHPSVSSPDELKYNSLKEKEDPSSTCQRLKNVKVEKSPLDDLDCERYSDVKQTSKSHKSSQERSHKSSNERKSNGEAPERDPSNSDQDARHHKTHKRRHSSDDHDSLGDPDKKRKHRHSSSKRSHRDSEKEHSSRETSRRFSIEDRGSADSQDTHSSKDKYHNQHRESTSDRKKESHKSRSEDRKDKQQSSRHDRSRSPLERNTHVSKHKKSLSHAGNSVASDDSDLELFAGNSSSSVSRIPSIDDIVIKEVAQARKHENSSSADKKRHSESDNRKTESSRERSSNHKKRSRSHDSPEKQTSKSSDRKTEHKSSKHQSDHKSSRSDLEHASNKPNSDHRSSRSYRVDDDLDDSVDQYRPTPIVKQEKSDRITSPRRENSDHKSRRNDSERKSKKSGSDHRSSRSDCVDDDLDDSVDQYRPTPIVKQEKSDRITSPPREKSDHKSSKNDLEHKSKKSGSDHRSSRSHSVDDDLDESIDQYRPTPIVKQEESDRITSPPREKSDHKSRRSDVEHKYKKGGSGHRSSRSYSVDDDLDDSVDQYRPTPIVKQDKSDRITSPGREKSDHKSRKRDAEHKSKKSSSDHRSSRTHSVDDDLDESIDQYRPTPIVKQEKSDRITSPQRVKSDHKSSKNDLEHKSKKSGSDHRSSRSYSVDDDLDESVDQYRPTPIVKQDKSDRITSPGREKSDHKSRKRDAEHKSKKSSSDHKSSRSYNADDDPHESIDQYEPTPIVKQEKSDRITSPQRAKSDHKSGKSDSEHKSKKSSSDHKSSRSDRVDDNLDDSVDQYRPTPMVKQEKSDRITSPGREKSDHKSRKSDAEHKSKKSSSDHKSSRSDNERKSRKHDSEKKDNKTETEHSTESSHHKHKSSKHKSSHKSSHKSHSSSKEKSSSSGSRQKRKISDEEAEEDNSNNGQSFEEMMGGVSCASQPVKKKKPATLEQKIAKTVAKAPLPQSYLDDLPELLTDYKPLPKISQGFESRHTKTDENSELSFADIKASSRSDAVYSGRRRGYTQMMPLTELCIFVLGNHIDDIGYVGGVPFSILEPVLKKATARQLLTIEDYNCDFTQDSDHLWKDHCARDFKGQKPDEFESWRELYLRKYEEREKKFEMLQSKIAAKEQMKQSETRKSMVNYAMSSVPKAPREVRRQQAKYGTASGSMESTARAAAIMKFDNNMRLPSARSSSGGSSNSSRSTAVKTIAVPALMKKTKKFFSKLQHR